MGDPRGFLKVNREDSAGPTRVRVQQETGILRTGEDAGPDGGPSEPERIRVRRSDHPRDREADFREQTGGATESGVRETGEGGDDTGVARAEGEDTIEADSCPQRIPGGHSADLQLLDALDADGVRVGVGDGHWEHCADKVSG